MSDTFPTHLHGDLSLVTVVPSLPLPCRPTPSIDNRAEQRCGGEILRTREQRAIDTENLRLQKKLAEVYRSTRLTTHGQHKGLLGPTIDCNQRWELRTSVYGLPSQSMRPGSARTPAAVPTTTTTTSAPMHPMQQRPGSAPRTRTSSSASSVPKTLGVASCAGCGSRSFRRADGPSLFPCRQCQRVFYCSETCARTDWQSHSQLCNYTTTGTWSPFGQRPEADCWVSNAAMARTRQALKARQAPGAPRMTYEEELDESDRLAGVMREERAKEKAAQAKQAQIEWRANMGMDGPRPCMCVNGKKI